MRLPWKNPEPLTSAQITAEFIALYREKRPDETPREIDGDSIEWEHADGSTHTVMLGKVGHEVARLERNTIGARREIYERFIDALFGGEPMPDSFDSAEFAGRILPAIRPRGYLEHVRAQTEMDAPHRDLTSELIIGYVIDFPDRVAHILSKQAEEMGLDEPQLFELAMKNLGELMSREAFRAAFDPTQMVTSLPCPDGHAAARLLLIRDYLLPGEETAVLVSDGATLALIEMPPGNNWNVLRKFAAQASPTGFSRPFWVRPGQIEWM